LRPILAWLLLPLAFTRRLRRGARQLSRAGGALLAVLTLAVLASLAACGGGGFFGHPVQNYTVTVTAVSGATTHTASVTLTLE
jgi:predicted small lipoprotein YifL